MSQFSFGQTGLYKDEGSTEKHVSIAKNWKFKIKKINAASFLNKKKFGAAMLHCLQFHPEMVDLTDILY
jgi:hypothetical protein